MGVLHAVIDAADAMGSISPALWSAYETTVFCAIVDGTEVRLRPGGMHPSLDGALERRSVRTWAYITAWNPGSQELSRQDNDVRHERLRRAVAHLGFEAFEGEGRPADPAWTPERSFLVLAVSTPAAVALGRRFEQNAIVVGEAGCKARLVACGRYLSCFP